MWFLRQGITLEYALIVIAASLFIILFVMPFHEIAHNFVAYKLGDDTAKSFGGLSLNVLDHIDFFGAISLLLFGMCWSKPIVLNPYNFKNTKIGVCLTSLAGPLFNILIVFLVALVSNCLIWLNFLPQSMLRILYSFFQSVMLLNLRIALFNLIPMPTLDGFGVVATFLPERILAKISMHRFYILIAFMILLALGVFSIPINAMTIKLYLVITKITGSPLFF